MKPPNKLHISITLHNLPMTIWRCKLQQFERRKIQRKATQLKQYYTCIQVVLRGSHIWVQIQMWNYPQSFKFIPTTTNSNTNSRPLYRQLLPLCVLTTKAIQLFYFSQQEQNSSIPNQHNSLKYHRSRYTIEIATCHVGVTGPTPHFDVVTFNSFSGVVAVLILKIFLRVDPNVRVTMETWRVKCKWLF